MRRIIADLRVISSSKAKLVRNSLLSSEVSSFGPYEGIAAAVEDAALAVWSPSRKLQNY
jgi:hypothetical protein